MINSKIVVVTLLMAAYAFSQACAKNSSMLNHRSLADTTDSSFVYQKEINAYHEGRRDSLFLRTLALSSFARKDTANTRKVMNDYFSGLHAPLRPENISLMAKLMTGTADKTFAFFNSNAERIDQVAGTGIAENKVMDMIFQQDIQPAAQPYLSHKRPGRPDWDSLERVLTGKYGGLGKAKVLSSRMVYAYSVDQDWADFGKSYARFFHDYARFWNDDLGGNNLAWAVFQYIDDPSAIHEAIVYIEKLVRAEQPSALELDTYANLLYKSGKTSQALPLEEKAHEMAPDDKWIISALDKMQKGQKTW